MSLQKKGRKYYSVYKENGRQIWVPLKTDNREEAKIREAELLKQRYSERFGLPKTPKDMPWDDFVKKYMAFQRGENRSEQTLLRDAVVFRNVTRHFPIRLLSDWTAEGMEGFKLTRTNSGIKPGTINKELAVLKSTFRFARRMGYREPGLLAVQDVKRVSNHGRPRPHYFSREELQILFREPDPVWRTISMMGALAGLRRGEILSLEWENIDWRSQTLRIVEKADWTPKTPGSARDIPMHPALSLHLKAWKALSTGSRKIVPWDREPHKFSGAFTSYLRRRGLPKGSLHSLRHTFGAYLAMADVNLAKISKLMGHRSLHTTMIYVQFQPSSLDDAVRKLPFFMGAQEKLESANPVPGAGLEASTPLYDATPKPSNLSSNPLAYFGQDGATSNKIPQLADGGNK